ncbi:hypothetical protein ACVXHB_11430 [Escherichia coli]
MPDLRKVFRIFGVDTTFHRMAANVNFFLLDRQRLTGSDTQLFLIQVNAVICL